MKKTLSAPFLTIIYKFVFSTVWIGGFGLGTLSLFLAGRDEKWGFLLIWVIVSYFTYKFCVRLKVVKIDDNFMYISNYRKTITVPLSEIDEIGDNPFINVRPIFIKFKHETSFGRNIVFTPKGFHYFREHPVVNEILEFIRNNPNNV